MSAIASGGGEIYENQEIRADDPEPPRSYTNTLIPRYKLASSISRGRREFISTGEAKISFFLDRGDERDR